MNGMRFVSRRISFAAGAIAFAASWSPLVADESPAEQANQQNSEAVKAIVDIDGDVRLFTTRVTAIHLASHSDLLGADVSQVDEVLRSHLGQGLVVTSVADEGPAAKAGIQKNDVLVTVGEEEITGLEAFRKKLEASPHAPLIIGLIRAGKKQSLMLTPRAATVRAEPDVENNATKPKYWLGVGLAPADDTLRSQLSLPAGEGLVVTSVEDGSPAAQAGVMVNDVLVQLDDKALTTIEALSEQLQAIADKSVSLKLLRRGKPAMLTVTPALHNEAVIVAPQWQKSQLWTDAALNSRYLLIGADSNVPHLTLQPYPATDAQWFPASNDPNLNSLLPGATDAATQLGNIEAQVKQLEASLAALRTTLGTPAQPPEGSAEKK